MTKHFNRHMLIPKEDKTFVSDQHIIWLECVTEIYQYCRNNDLILVWSYLWCEWYSPNQWILWVQSSFEEIGILCTTMVHRNSRYPLISTSLHNSWQEIHSACNLEKPDNDYLVNNNDVNNESSTINITQEIYETSSNNNLMNEIEQKHILLC
ncbi:2371_t:CDS:2 [Dentiscutata erythropus]|uniref:2371_t:CDS:1 n=1 Tax=Dentiscutata erythropus TaxID=1348616 RepID=A0A9N9N6B2_9GLOM|nr:2371_t:CDS:2 [Dentiscutata erythropus]